MSICGGVAGGGGGGPPGNTDLQQRTWLCLAILTRSMSMPLRKADWQHDKEGEA
jgi:hypothetical protein